MVAAVDYTPLLMILAMGLGWLLIVWQRPTDHHHPRDPSDFDQPTERQQFERDDNED